MQSWDCANSQIAWNIYILPSTLIMHQWKIILVVKQWQIRTWCTNIACYCVRYQGLLLPEKYYHFTGSNKPDIQKSESALFVLLYSLCLHTKLCQGFEVRNDAKPKLPAMKSHHISPNLASTCMHSRTTTLLASKGLDGNVRLVASSCLRLIVRDWLVPSLSNNDTGSIFKWHSNNDATFGTPSFESMLCQ